jgi:uncharacterized small protein (TIGR04563 family)
MSGKARRISLYFPDDVAQEIDAEARRQDRSMSWLVVHAWRIARAQIAKSPTAPVNTTPT